MAYKYTTQEEGTFYPTSRISLPGVIKEGFYNIARRMIFASEDGEAPNYAVLPVVRFSKIEGLDLFTGATPGNFAIFVPNNKNPITNGERRTINGKALFLDSDRSKEIPVYNPSLSAELVLNYRVLEVDEDHLSVINTIEGTRFFDHAWPTIEAAIVAEAPALDSPQVRALLKANQAAFLQNLFLPDSGFMLSIISNSWSTMGEAVVIPGVSFTEVARLKDQDKPVSEKPASSPATGVSRQSQLRD